MSNVKCRVRVYALIPAYNEEKAIRAVVQDAKKYVDEVIVVDDGSNDATSSEARAGGAFVLRHILNRGQGAALQTGFDYIKKAELHVAFAAEVWSRSNSIVVTFDADGQFEASEIPKFIEPIIHGEADVVLGSRFIGTAPNMPRVKKIFLKLAIYFTNLTTGLRLSDTHNGFRAFSKAALRDMQISEDRMAHGSEILSQIAKHKLRYKEMPVTVHYSAYSMMKGQKIGDYFKILFDLFLRKLVQ